MLASHNYLHEQCADVDGILQKIKAVAQRGDFTLGAEVAQFEEAFARLCGTKYAIGVANGTDALTLILRQLPQGEVITTPFSFSATVAAIVHAGHKPVFVDVREDFNIDPSKIEHALTKKTIAFLPVHWAGRPCRMNELLAISDRCGIPILEDACQAIGATYNGRPAGSLGLAAAFSLHPLKNLNIWGDGGMITTNDAGRAQALRKTRNHGFRDRNTVDFWGWNSRLDTVQAVIGLHGISQLEGILAARRKNAKLLNNLLAEIPGIEIPETETGVEPGYHLYPIHAERRDELLKYLATEGIGAKVHYPVPLHLQPAALTLGYKRGDFPLAEWCADTTLSLPIHQFVSEDIIAAMAKVIAEFYK